MRECKAHLLGPKVLAAIKERDKKAFRQIAQAIKVCESVLTITREPLDVIHKDGDDKEGSPVRSVMCYLDGFRFE